MIELLDRIQDSSLSRAISESTWGYPLVGAIHVLALALFGGTVLITNLRAYSQLASELRGLKVFGLGLVIASGALLFASGAVHYYESGGFRIKILLLVLILLNAILASLRKRNTTIHSGIALALWAAVIFAARAIAFF